MFFNKSFLFSIIAAGCVLTSCAYPVEFALRAGGEVFEVRSVSKEAASGLIEASGKKRVYQYALQRAAVAPVNASCAVLYTVEQGGYGAALELRLGENSPAWQLPLDGSFLGKKGQRDFRYAVPVDADFSFNTFSFTAENVESVQIREIEITSRVFGFDKAGGVLFASPYVYAQGANFVINPPENYNILGGKSFLLKGLPAGAEVSTKSFSYKRTPYGQGTFSLPAGITGRLPYPITAGGGALSAVLVSRFLPEFPAPIPADPGLILDYPQEVWRNEDYEIFSWEQFPEIIIFDTANYSVQDRLFKRLAFFVEKKGYRGKIITGREFDNGHGWNAHDYQPEDLAEFFNRTAAERAPLFEEEIALRGTLVSLGIIIEENGVYAAGKGAVLSISRESNGYLRRLFMAHEGFHGLYFIDKDFRDFTARRYAALDRTAKQVFLEYLDQQNYDNTDNFLVQNEFMSYLLQQSADAAPEYFGKTIPQRLAQSSWRRAVLPPQDADGSWGSLAAAFAREARAFSDYAAERWNLAGGCVWTVER